jgi:cobalamin biosynthesis Co2+ chelatase CbiK
MIEMLLPLSAKIEFDAICRRMILKMEVEGGLNTSAKNELLSELSDKGFTNVAIQGTSHARYGEELSLVVTGEYEYSMLSDLFTRKDSVGKMKYDKITISRKVIN